MVVESGGWRESHFSWAMMTESLISRKTSFILVTCLRGLLPEFKINREREEGGIKLAPKIHGQAIR